MTETSVVRPKKYTRAFWIDAGDRVVSTAAQAGLGVATAAGFNLLEIDAAGIGAVIGTAALISVLKAFAVVRSN